MYKQLTLSVIILCITFFTGCGSQKQIMDSLPISDIPSDASIDMRGKQITPYIIYNANEKLKTMKENEVLEVITDNFELIENDMNAWSRMTGYKILNSPKKDRYQRFYIQKITPKASGKKFAMVLSKSGLEDLLAPLGTALAAGLAGMEVSIDFQGPAVEILSKDFKEKLPGINSLFSGYAREGLAEIGHIPAQDKLKQLKSLGAHFYVCGPSMDHFGVKKSDLIFDDVIFAEYLTVLEVMEKADISLYIQ
jgi:predicted peroxiredoxin/TusA-related sulfurtransferase